MSLWIPITLAAAFFQNLRFMLQKQLKSTRLSTTGATFSRFVYSAPLVAGICGAYAAGTGTGTAAGWPGPGFWGFAVLGGLCQIIGTLLVVALFAERNFAVGITLKKTEVMLTALAGIVILGEAVSVSGLAAIAVGFAGVFLLSSPSGSSPSCPGASERGGWRARLINRASVYGIGAGLFFGLCSTAYRAATLAVPSDDFILRAGLTLAVVTAFQTLVMLAWMFLFDRAEIGRVLAAWRVGSLVGLSSMAGSLCWFMAFALMNAAYVKALGQIELVFTFLTSYFVFGERSTRRELAGVALLIGSVLLLVLVV